MLSKACSSVGESMDQAVQNNELRHAILHEHAYAVPVDVWRQRIEHHGALNTFLEAAAHDPALHPNIKKYIDLERWLPKYITIARLLALHRTTGKRILDIGSGCGWFGLLCKELGHEPLGLDHPERSRFYRECCEIMGIPVIDHDISPFTPLPVPGKFDIIVLLMSSFYIQHTYWEIPAWRNFLQNLDELLGKDGIILFELNMQYGVLYPVELYDLFVECGYRIAGRFCLKVRGKRDASVAGMFALLQNVDRQKSVFLDLWRRAVHRQLLFCFPRTLAQLRSISPEAVDLHVQQALFFLLLQEPDKALPILRQAVELCAYHPGYHLLLARLLYRLGQKEMALMVVEKARIQFSENILLQEWEKLLQMPEDMPAGDISAFWRTSCATLRESSVFEELRYSSHFRACMGESSLSPESWYLRYGAVSLPLEEGFVPLIYWGMYNDVLLSGEDPLVHYITVGQKKNFAI